MRSRREEEKAQKWFKPHVADKTESIIAAKRPELLKESESDRAARLCHDDAEAREKKRREIEQLVYGGITFTPTIDPISRALGREPNIGNTFTYICVSFLQASGSLMATRRVV